MKHNENSAAFALILSEIKSGQLPSAIVLEGKDEASRHKTALLCAQALLCEGETESIPCGKCGPCTKTGLGRHPDVAVLCPKDGTPLKVDDIRRVRSDAYVCPFEADKKIIIFEMAHMLNVQSQNALLKILEEPPKNVYFILTCPSGGMLLPTVSSRCAKFSLGALGRSEIYRSVCKIAEKCSDTEKESLTAAICYLDDFEFTDKNIERLSGALDVCREFYAGGRFPYGLIPTKKEDSEALKLIFKALALCALEVSTVKKGAEKKQGLLSAEAQAAAASRLPLKKVFSQYEFFCEMLERLGANANVGAVLAAMRTEPCLQSK